jgi:hypothetical protein
MNDAINPKVAAETARDTYRKTAAPISGIGWQH